MADKRAPNDAGDSDNTGEPKTSARRWLQDAAHPKTTAPRSIGLEDSWKAGTRNVTGSGFEPDELKLSLRSCGHGTQLPCPPPGPHAGPVPLWRFFVLR